MSVRVPDLKSVMLAGHVGRDPEFHVLSSGSSVGVMNVAVRLFKRGDDTRQPLWLTVKAFGKASDAMANLHKGSPVIVIGELDQEEWNGHADGERKTKIVVVAHRVMPLTWDSATATKTAIDEASKEIHSTADGDEDLPF